MFNSITDLRAEAIFQMNEADKSGIQKIIATDNGPFIKYNNGVSTLKEGNTLSIQWEDCNGKLHVCKF